jgi:hypothetical protein
MIGAGVFMITVFSVNATIITGGFILTALSALAVLGVLFFRLRKGASQPATAAGTTLLWVAHGLLFAANLVVVIFLPQMVYGFVFRPPGTGQQFVTAGTIVAAVAACAVLSAWIVIGRSRQRP